MYTGVLIYYEILEKNEHQYGIPSKVCHTWGLKYFRNRLHNWQNPVTKGQKTGENGKKTDQMGRKKGISTLAIPAKVGQCRP